MIRTRYVNTSYHTGTYQHVQKYRDINKDTKCSLHFRTHWCVIKNPSDEKCGETARFVANAKCVRSAERVSGILLRRESLPRCKRGRWARSRQALLVVYVLQQNSVVPGTMHCCCFIIRHTNKIAATKSAGLRSDL